MAGDGDVFGSQRNLRLGGQSVSCWDGALAPYVDKSFKKCMFNAISDMFAYKSQVIIDNVQPGLVYQTLKAATEKYFKYGMNRERGNTKDTWRSELDIAINAFENELRKDLLLKQLINEMSDVVRETGKSPGFEASVHMAYSKACWTLEEETKQAMEAAIHNFNSLHSRAGGQTPFSSINYGMDTSPEGRLVTRMTLEAIWNGLGNEETPIFPISVFNLKSGVNYNPEDPNYDLFKLACKVSAKRLFPNFTNADAPYNLQYYKEGDYRTYPTTMGCRTRVLSNVNGPNESSSRGNFAFVTINLPMLALDAKGDVNKFFKLFDKYIKLSKEYLEYRYSIIAHKKVKNFPFLMGQGLWMDSDKLGPEDEIAPVLKHASLSIGFCGLAECLVALIGKHHGESEEAQELGLKIVSHLREMTDKFANKTHMNWSTFASPAESTAGDFLRATRKKYGIIPGVTDHEYFTNSSHLPVYYKCTAAHKVDVEAPYHEYCNAGCIGYVEMDGDPLKNLDAFEKIVRYMHDKNMNYFSINHPVDRDPVCGYTGIIDNECPHCHRHENGIYEFKMNLN